MASSRPAGNKRAPPPRACDYTKAFLKDWERLSRSGRYDLRLLKEVMLLLIANDSPLGPKWLDHPLKGQCARALVLQRLERSLQVLENARLASRQPSAIQFSVSNPGTRSNSGRLLVTSVSPSLRVSAGVKLTHPTE